MGRSLKEVARKKWGEDKEKGDEGNAEAEDVKVKAEVGKDKVEENKVYGRK